MLQTNYDRVITLPHPSGDYLGYSVTDTDTGITYTDGAMCDAYCKVGDCEDWAAIDMQSKFMTEPLWVLGGWYNEEDFRVDCSCEGYGRDSGTGWVERQLLEVIPRKYAIRRGII